MPSRLRFTSATQAEPTPQLADSLALVALTRLVRAGAFPQGTRASDPLKPTVLSALSARFPGKPVPANVGDLVRLFVGDSDSDGRVDVDLDALEELALVALDVPELKAASRASFAADDFVAVAGEHQALRRAAASELPVRYQRSAFVDELEVSQDSPFGPVSLLESQGVATLTLQAPLHLDGDGRLGRGPGPGPTDARRFERARLVVDAASRLELELLSSSDSAKLWLSPSGSLRVLDGAGAPVSGASGTPSADSKWLVDALLTTIPEAVAVPRVRHLVQARAELEARRALVDAPPEAGERIAWAAARVGDEYATAAAEAEQQASGVRPLRWHRWLDGLSGPELARAVLDATGGQEAIAPAFLYTVAIGEGLLNYLDSRDGGAEWAADGRVDGFLHLGLDTFASSAKELVREGHLPAWFAEGRDFTVSPRVNEKQQEVQSANFPDLRRGLVALRATLAHCRARFLADAGAVAGRAASSFSRDELDFFTYLYLNAGAGAGRKWLRRRGLAELLRPWRGKPPSGSGVARFNALQRLTTARFIERLKLFPPKSPAGASGAPPPAPGGPTPATAPARPKGSTP